MTPGGRRSRALPRVLSVVRFLTMAALASVFVNPQGNGATADAADAAAQAQLASPATAPATKPVSPAVGGVPGEVVDALRGLAVPADRERLYGVLSDKGDARIINAILAFEADHLRVLDGRLVMNGTDVRKAEVNGAQHDYYLIVDAITGQPVPGPAGQPIYQRTKGSRDIRDFDRAPAYTRTPDRKAEQTFPGIGSPLNRRTVAELRAALSLLHPDPELRLASIREAGERAAKVFPDPADEAQLKAAMAAYAALGEANPIPLNGAADPHPDLLKAFEAVRTEAPKGLLGSAPSEETVSALMRPLEAVVKLAKDAKVWPEPGQKPGTPRVAALTNLSEIATKYKERLGTLKKNAEELPRYQKSLRKQLNDDPTGPFAPAYKEALAQIDAVLGDEPTQKASVVALGDFGTMRAANVLRKLRVAAERSGDTNLAAAVDPALSKADSRQARIRFVNYTFAGLSTGSIYVLLALGLAVIFGLMGVINMAHGEFMMIGAFTTLVVSRMFTPGTPAYDFFPFVAIPAAFVVAALFGLATEFLVIRHLYGRTTETLLATIGVGLILVQVARDIFGSSVSYAAPRWMQGSIEVVPDLLLNRARLWTIVYCVLCITTVYLIVNKTKLGLLLRATTQNRKMAAALGVPTRRVDAMTFAFGAGLAGLAGVVVPMIDKINPEMGQDYVVMSFMVVVVGGVGKLAGAIIAGLGLGSIGNYLEPALGSIAAFAKTSSVLSKVIVLTAIVLFLQKRPSGLFPPKGRTADA